MNKTKVFQRFFAFSLILTIIGSEIYRPYAWLNQLRDFGLADSCTNIGAVLTASFLFMAYCHSDNDIKNYQIIIETATGFAIYELMQKYLPCATFDWKDIVGTAVGAIIALFIYKIVVMTVEKGHEKEEKNIGTENP